MSQGAALAGLLVGLRAPDGRPTEERPLCFDSYSLPSLHLVGRSDGVVPIDDSLALAARFEKPVIVEHGGATWSRARRACANACARF